jgi:hypothetical protein
MHGTRLKYRKANVFIRESLAGASRISGLLRYFSQVILLNFPITFVLRHMFVRFSMSILAQLSVSTPAPLLYVYVALLVLLVRLTTMLTMSNT